MKKLLQLFLCTGIFINVANAYATSQRPLRQQPKQKTINKKPVAVAPPSAPAKSAESARPPLNPTPPPPPLAPTNK